MPLHRLKRTEWIKKNLNRIKINEMAVSVALVFLGIFIFSGPHRSIAIFGAATSHQNDRKPISWGLQWCNIFASRKYTYSNDPNFRAIYHFINFSRWKRWILNCFSHVSKALLLLQTTQLSYAIDWTKCMHKSLLFKTLKGFMAMCICVVCVFFSVFFSVSIHSFAASLSHSFLHSVEIHSFCYIVLPLHTFYNVHFKCRFVVCKLFYGGVCAKGVFLKAATTQQQQLQQQKKEAAIFNSNCC